MMWDDSPTSLPATSYKTYRMFTGSWPTQCAEGLFAFCLLMPCFVFISWTNVPVLSVKFGLLAFIYPEFCSYDLVRRAFWRFVLCFVFGLSDSHSWDRRKYLLFWFLWHCTGCIGCWYLCQRLRQALWTAPCTSASDGFWYSRVARWSLCNWCAW